MNGVLLHRRVAGPARSEHRLQGVRLERPDWRSKSTVSPSQNVTVISIPALNGSGKLSQTSLRTRHVCVKARRGEGPGERISTRSQGSPPGAQPPTIT